MVAIMERVGRRVPSVPLLYEDEFSVSDMGEHDLHTETNKVVDAGLREHFHGQKVRVFQNLNTYYRAPEARPDRPPCFAADVMVVRPDRPLPKNPPSYRIPEDGPAPILTVETLSKRTKKVDFDRKPIVYAYLGVPEFILIDVSGQFLPERLLLRRLQDDGTWQDCQDDDGGVTSQLGFRLVIEDGRLRMTNAAGKPYLRPDELHEESAARRRAERRHRAAIKLQQATEKARRAAEEREQVADDARRAAEEREKAADDARRAAELEKQAADDARRAAESRVRELEAELRRRKGR